MNRFKWINEIQVVNGFNRSCIYDLPRNSYEFGPCNIDKFVKKIEQSNFKFDELNEVEQEWFIHLRTKEFFFEVPGNLYDSFNSLELNYDHPSLIINAIVHENSIDKVIEFLDEVICKHLLIICESDKSVQNLLTKYFKKTNFQSVGFIFKESSNIDYYKLKSKFPILNGLFKSNSIASSPLLIVNIEHYTESRNYNSYFHRKIFIDNKGRIRNSIETMDDFGDINQLNNFDDFVEIIESDQFKKLWTVTKDKCDVCKNCELRYMCLDNRVPIQREKNEWYYHTECNYNPYITKWKDEEGYRTLAECGVISNENGFSIDHEKIAKINEELWGED